MDYKSLEKIFYTDDTIYQEEYNNRFNSYCTYKCGISIKPIMKEGHYKDSYELFIVNLTTIVNLVDHIYNNSKAIKEMCEQMPSLLFKTYFNKLLINELIATNEIESVRTTKKELIEVLENITEDNEKLTKYKRFTGLLKNYKYLISDDYTYLDFQDVKDFRHLYDDLVSKEIEQENKLDGQLFRKNPVFILSGNKVSHHGISNEAEIIQSLKELTTFMNDHSILKIYRIMLGHFLFEYIHPFYDGNGRVGRMYTSLFITKELDPFSAVTFAYSINLNKKKYYNALENVSKVKNKADATLYIKDLLEILITGQESLLEDLNENFAKYSKIKENIGTMNSYSEAEKQILLQLVQIKVFTSSVLMPNRKVLLDILGIQEYIFKKNIINLEKDGIVKKIKSRPIIYDVDDTFIERLLNN